MLKAINIRDVARQAGVSTATVSRVINASGKVSADTQDRVQGVIRRLGFEPNQAARILRTSRASKILVTVPDIASPFFASVIKGAEEVARSAGYAVMLGDTGHVASVENEYAAMLLQREVDGFLFLGHRLPDRFVDMLAASHHQPPIVNGCEYSPGLDVPSVHIDNPRAAYEVIEYLVELGHRDIGVITGTLESPISRDRLSGVEKAAARHLVQRRIRIRNGEFSVSCGFDMAAELIADGVTAIFCFGDEVAIGALSAVQGRGLDCPRDISIVGFDDIHLARYMRPSLTTVAQPKEEIGKEAMRFLLRILAGEQIRQTLTLPHKLIVRGSTGAPPTGGKDEQ